MKLLIAEDEAIIRMDLKETLQDLGYEIVVEARSGREAVQKAFAFAAVSSKKSSCTVSLIG